MFSNEYEFVVNSHSLSSFCVRTSVTASAERSGGCEGGSNAQNCVKLLKGTSKQATSKQQASKQGFVITSPPHLLTSSQLPLPAVSRKTTTNWQNSW